VSYLSRLDVSTHTVWERSKGGQQLGFTDAWCAKHLADAVPENERSTLRPGRNWSSSAFIEAILEGDRTAPRKAAAHRATGSGAGSERRCQKSTLRSPRFVDTSGAEDSTAIVGQETFIPQSYAWGGEAQVDWYEAYADICGERELAYVFCMRAWPAEELSIAPSRTPASKRFWKRTNGVRLFFWSFSKLFVTTTSECGEKDSARTPARGATRFIAFRSHWGSSRSSVHRQRATRRECRRRSGYFAGTTWCPCRSGQLGRTQCSFAGGSRTMNSASSATDPDGRGGHEPGARTPACTIGRRLRSGRGSLSACERQRLREGADQLLFGSTAGRYRSAGQGAFSLRGDSASGTVRGTTRTLLRSQQKVLNLEHYLEALTKKPGAFAGCTPLEQWRAQGRWPASFDRFWEALKQRRGKQPEHAL